MSNLVIYDPYPDTLLPPLPVRQASKAIDTSYVDILDKAKTRFKQRGKSLSLDWEKVMKKSSVMSDQSSIPEQEIVEKPEFTFCTGSKYEGEWDQLELTGLGRYTLLNGVCYQGHLKENEFHGIGTLRYPKGSEMTGLFVNGRLVSHDHYRFADGKELERYCEKPDRRYYEEIQNGLKAAGRSNKANLVPPRDIPNGMYDAGDGFYDPRTKCVYDPEDRKHILRIPTKDEHNWILAHCRKAWDEPVGFRPDLYENWYPKLPSRFSEYHSPDYKVPWIEQWWTPSGIRNTVFRQYVEDKIKELNEGISTGSKSVKSKTSGTMSGSTPKSESRKRVRTPVSIQSRSESRKKRPKLFQNGKDDTTSKISWKLDRPYWKNSDYINASDLDLDSLEPLSKWDLLIQQDISKDTPRTIDGSRTLSTLTERAEIII